MNKFISTVVLTSFCAFAFAANDKKIELGKYEGLKYSANDVPAAVEAGAKPKNIILLIGDGMGSGAFNATSLYIHGENGKLFMEQLPVKGMLKTRSLNSGVTDSAAAATAMATGNKVNNGNIGGRTVKSEEGTNFVPLKSYATLSNEKGKAIAIITSDSIAGATPSAFFAHKPSRHDFGGILTDLMDCKFDVVLGGNNTLKWLCNKDNAAVVAKIADTHVITEGMSEFEAAPADKKVIAHLDSKFLDKETSVAEFMNASIARVEKNPNGFFMMVECCYPDKGGHGNDPSKTVLGTIHMDIAVKAAVDFANKNKDTLVIVTADHETGSISASSRDDKEMTITYNSGSHSAANVPVYAFGPGAELFAGEIDNTVLAKNIASLLGVELEILK
ncbi:MAG: alkaline phosphatase [Kiritimatiellae bacterium]|nr:alkaline phosphatase [Kiritimatiellia bacterium]